MLTLIKFTAMTAAVVTTVACTTDADAGGCRRSRGRIYVVPTRPAGPGGARGAVGPGAPAPGAAGQAAAGQGQGAAGQGQGAQAQDADSQEQADQAVSVPAGATITLPGNRGGQMGEVNLVLGEVRLPLTIVEWNETGVTLVLPDMQITSATEAQIEIQSAGSGSAETISIQLEPQPSVLIVEPSADVVPPPPAAATTEELPMGEGPKN